MTSSAFDLAAGPRTARGRNGKRSLRALPDAVLIARVLNLDSNVGLELSFRGLQRENLAVELATCLTAGRGNGPRFTGPELDRLAALTELVRRLNSSERSATHIRSASDVLLWAGPRLVHLEHEELWLLCVDGNHVLTAAERVAQGGLHGCGVTARDVLRPAVRNAAAAVVVVHNHPSGDPTPSLEDVAMTEQLAQACNILGVPLLDHVVVARAGARSAVAALR
jgi:DNA repair protein RadC